MGILDLLLYNRSWGTRLLISYVCRLCSAATFTRISFNSWQYPFWCTSPLSPACLTLRKRVQGSQTLCLSCTPLFKVPSEFLLARPPPSLALRAPFRLFSDMHSSQNIDSFGMFFFFSSFHFASSESHSFVFKYFSWIRGAISLASQSNLRLNPTNDSSRMFLVKLLKILASVFVWFILPESVNTERAPTRHTIAPTR